MEKGKEERGRDGERKVGRVYKEGGRKRKRKEKGLLQQW